MKGPPGFGAPSSLHFTPDGQTLVSDYGIQGLYFWDVVTGREKRHLRELGFVLCWSLDGNFLVSGYSQKETPSSAVARGVALWEVPTGCRVSAFLGHECSIHAAALSRKSELLATAGMDNTVLLWDPFVPGDKEAPLAQGPLDAKKLDQLWSDLDDKSERGYWALCSLVAARESALAYVRGHLLAEPTKDRKRIKQLIADLDSDEFSVREASHKELEKIIFSIQEEVLLALKANPSAEVQSHLEALSEGYRLRFGVGSLAANPGDSVTSTDRFSPGSGNLSGACKRRAVPRP